MSETLWLIVGVAIVGAYIGGWLLLYGIGIAIVLAPIVWVVRRVWKG